MSKTKIEVVPNTSAVRLIEWLILNFVIFVCLLNILALVVRCIQYATAFKDVGVENLSF